MHRLGCLCCALLIGIAGCAPDEAPAPANTPTGTVDTASQTADPPGKAHYDRACATCHEGTVEKAPRRDMIGLMTPEAILAAQTTGLMQAQASVLTEEQRIEVAEYLAGTSIGTNVPDIQACATDIQFNSLAPASAGNWGLQPGNNRHITKLVGGIDADNVGHLRIRWAASFPGANRARSQPVFAGGLVFVGSHNGQVYALDQQSGCKVWAYRAAAEVRTAIVVGPWTEDDQTTRLYFGDVLGNVYAIDARTGEERWRKRADDHPNATITGTPSLSGGSLYVPISALEVALAVDPKYPCCTFRGSVLALDAASGETQWRTHTIEQAPAVQKQNEVGTDMIGPSGAVVWNSPAIDGARQQLYFGTGENMSSPATKTSDALFALDLNTGAVKWTYQATANDAWNTACDTATPQNCPDEDGPDFDFGAATLLVNGLSAGDLVIGGQKSGVVHALNPDTGQLVWETRVGRGGIQGGVHFGMAANDKVLFVPVSDMEDGRTYPDPSRPGMHALDLNTGRILWSTIHEDLCGGRAFCHTGISQVPTVIGDLVVAGGMDGHVRAYRVDTGEIVWILDSTQPFDSVTGRRTHGGSFGGSAGPVAFNGMLLLSSGYGIYNHMPGNLLLMLMVAR